MSEEEREKHQMRVPKKTAKLQMKAERNPPRKKRGKTVKIVRVFRRFNEYEPYEPALGSLYRAIFILRFFTRCFSHLHFLIIFIFFNLVFFLLFCGAMFTINFFGLIVFELKIQQKKSALGPRAN